MKQRYLSGLARNWHTRKAGGHAEGARGIMSACTASALCIEAALREALRRGGPALIEATANQVNPDGGYTGMNAAAYRDFVFAIAGKIGFPREALMLGGDHIGPLPYKALPAEEAMAKAEKLVYEYAAAGFSKLHLDTSMALATDAVHPSDELIASRAASLARAAAAGFAAWKRPPASGAAAAAADTAFPEFIIGSEVPVPGGAAAGGGKAAEAGGGKAAGAHGRPAVTSGEAFRATVEAFKAAFQKNGAEEVWQNVAGVVVQPGVEFGDDEVFAYNAAEAASLCAALKDFPGIIFEGHSTDYQSRTALREMTRDGVCILKVGPALTFYQREALFALSAIETELFEGGFLPSALSPSCFPQTLEAAMLAFPASWQNYYPGSAAEQRYKRKYSYSDRSRYYMGVPEVAQAAGRLFANLAAAPVPLALLSQYMPAQAAKVSSGEIENTPQSLVLSRITDVIEDYTFAVR